MKKRTSESGLSYIDAIIALVITSVLIGGGLLMLGGAPRRIIERVQVEQDRIRYIQLWRILSNELSNIKPAWWSSGPLVIENEDAISIIESNTGDGKRIEISKRADGEVFIQSNDRELILTFHMAPTWIYTKQEPDIPSHLTLSHPIFGDVSVSLGGQPLLLPNTERPIP